MKTGGLILAAKPEDAAMWRQMFEKAGRKEDLIVFGPNHPCRFNFLSYVLHMGGSTREVTRCLTTIGEALNSSETRGGENADFFERETERQLYNAIEVIKQATGTVSAPDIQRFISSAPLSVDQIATPAWQKGYCNQCLEAAFNKPKSAIALHDYELATDYWLSEYPNMADRTRSSILTGTMGLLHTFNTGIVRELISTSTNITPDDTLAGKWLLVDMARAEWGDAGAVVGVGWKFLTQKRILRREAKAGDCIHVIWCDEAQQAVTQFDSDYIAQCRSHWGCMVFLTQSLASYYSALRGERGKNRADVLLSSFHHKIFHALGDVRTAEYASGLVGRTLTTFLGSSTPPMENMDQMLFGNSRVSTTTNESYEHALQNAAFMNGLRTGGKANDNRCDAFLVRNGEAFANGLNFLFLTFSQKG